MIESPPIGVQGASNASASQTLFLRFIDEYGAADAARAAAIETIKDLRKRMRSAGFDLKAVDEARTIAALDPEKRAKLDARQQALVEYLDWLGKPLNYQRNFAFPAGNGGNLAEEPPPVRPETLYRNVALDSAARRRIEIQGQIAGGSGAERSSNPWKKESESWRIWDSAWESGRGERVRPVALPPKRPRGRPRKTPAKEAVK